MPYLTLKKMEKMSLTEEGRVYLYYHAKEIEGMRKKIEKQRTVIEKQHRIISDIKRRMDTVDFIYKGVPLYSSCNNPKTYNRYYVRYDGVEGIYRAAEVWECAGSKGKWYGLNLKNNKVRDGVWFGIGWKKKEAVLAANEYAALGIVPELGRMPTPFIICVYQLEKLRGE